MRSFLRFATLALILIVVAMLSALTAIRIAIHGQEVAVPPLVGLTPNEAERQLSSLGLHMSIETQYYSPQIPEGHLMSQLPLPGTKVRRGWQVRVAQSLGPTRVAIPDVAGQSQHAAELNIRRRGLDITSVALVQAAGLPPDQVLAQNPTANATQVLAPKISLLVTTPADPPQYVMPSFVGQLLGTANKTLIEEGFKLGNVTVAPPPIALVPDATGQTPPGNPPPAQSPPPASSATIPLPQPSPASTIVSQYPASGQKVAVGVTVSFEVR